MASSAKGNVKITGYNGLLTFASYSPQSDALVRLWTTSTSFMLLGVKPPGRLAGTRSAISSKAISGARAGSSIMSVSTRQMLNVARSVFDAANHLI